MLLDFLAGVFKPPVLEPFLSSALDCFFCSSVTTSYICFEVAEVKDCFFVLCDNSVCRRTEPRDSALIPDFEDISDRYEPPPLDPVLCKSPDCFCERSVFVLDDDFLRRRTESCDRALCLDLEDTLDRSEL